VFCGFALADEFEQHNGKAVIEEEAEAIVQHCLRRVRGQIDVIWDKIDRDRVSWLEYQVTRAWPPPLPSMRDLTCVLRMLCQDFENAYLDMLEETQDYYGASYAVLMSWHQKVSVLRFTIFFCRYDKVAQCVKARIEDLSMEALTYLDSDGDGFVTRDEFDSDPYSVLRKAERVANECKRRRCSYFS